MSSRKGRGPVRGQSIRSRPAAAPGPIHRGRSWENRDPERHLSGERDEGGAGRLKLKNCCRSVATFMCTQVGVGGVIVGYAIVGAFAFIALETDLAADGDATLNEIIRIRSEAADDLYLDFTQSQWSEKDWENVTDQTLKNFQDHVVRAVQLGGYDGRTVHDKWNFPAALMFTLSIFTMIGYGNLVPRTDWGKVVTIVYAVFGIPLYVLYFLNMGRALARAFKWIYIKFNTCTLGGSRHSSAEEFDYRGRSGGGGVEKEAMVVPSTASLYVLISYIGVGTIMFAEWEGWEYLNSVYFCVISLCKIGLGDFVPGTSIDGTLEGNQTKLVINFVYLLLGLGLVAMCYNLLREEVLAKMKQLKSDIKDVFHLVRQECNCCNGK